MCTMTTTLLPSPQTLPPSLPPDPLSLLPPLTPLPELDDSPMASPPASCRPLLDIQNNADTRGVTLQKVGVSKVRTPLWVQGLVAPREDNTVPPPVQTIAEVSLGVLVPAEQKGTHLSRFIAHLEAWRQQGKPIDTHLAEFMAELTQYLESPQGYCHLRFPWTYQKAAPVTGQSAPQVVDVALVAEYHAPTQALTTTVWAEVPVSTLCPCSKAISDFGAHNQRAVIRAGVRSSEVIALTRLIEGLEACGSCDVYPLLKRTDEKWVTERQYTNAKFVEDVMRDAILWLRTDPFIEGFSLEIEALESIHAHNAWCFHEEGLSVYKV
jgi:GTP cyclohydrolase IB